MSIQPIGTTAPKIQTKHRKKDNSFVKGAKIGAGIGVATAGINAAHAVISGDVAKTAKYARNNGLGLALTSSSVLLGIALAIAVRTGICALGGAGVGKIVQLANKSEEKAEKESSKKNFEANV